MDTVRVDWDAMPAGIADVGAHRPENTGVASRVRRWLADLAAQRRRQRRRWRGSTGACCATSG